MSLCTRFLLFLTLWLPIPSIAQPLLLTDDYPLLDTRQQLEYLEDKTAQLNIEQISRPEYQQRFKLKTNNSANFGRNKSAYWLKFNIQQLSEMTWYLVINNVILAEYELFIFPAHHALQHPSRTPLFTKLSRRLPTYRLNLEKSRHYSVYLRLSNKGKGILNAPILFMNADRLQSKTNYEHLFLGCMMMGIITMAIYNLLLFIRLKDNDYLNLSIMQIAITFMLQRINNIIPLKTDVSNPDNPLFYIVFFFFMGTSINLLRSLLNTKIDSPLTDKLLIALLIAVLFLIPLL